MHEIHSDENELDSERKVSRLRQREKEKNEGERVRVRRERRERDNETVKRRTNEEKREEV